MAHYLLKTKATEQEFTVVNGDNGAAMRSAIAAKNAIAALGVDYTLWLVPDPIPLLSSMEDF